MGRPTLSLVIPVYNEEVVLPLLHPRLQEFLTRLALPVEVIFVNDGSKDRSLELLRVLAAEDPRYRVVSLARNFGHQAAITAGLDYARGEAVVVMDADLQDPPEVVVDMVAKWKEGYDVVYGRRRLREAETFFKLLSARIFYRVFAAMVPITVPLDAGDFRLMSRRVVIALRALKETHRFVRGMVAWVGFRQTAVLYDRQGRAAGQTKYPLRRMVRFAIDGITSFSIQPLRFSSYLGIFISVASIAVACWAVIAHFFLKTTVPGWTAEIVMISLLAAAQLLMIGVLGEYVGRIYEQVKARPLYLVDDVINTERAPEQDDLDPTEPD